MTTRAPFAPLRGIEIRNLKLNSDT